MTMRIEKNDTMPVIGWIYIFVITLVSFSSNGCGNDTAEDIVRPAEYHLGESIGGGIVFYIDERGEHGLIAAAADQSRSIQWFNGTYAATNAAAAVLGGGQSNTTAIITIQKEGNYAASICDKLILNGYSDWFLPSKDELDMLYRQKDKVGGFSESFYWSSTEHGEGSAWEQNFINGAQYYANKNFPVTVRAIRSF